MDLEEKETAINYIGQGRFHGSGTASFDHSKNRELRIDSKSGAVLGAREIQNYSLLRNR